MIPCEIMPCPNQEVEMMPRVLVACVLGVILVAGCEGGDKPTKRVTDKSNRNSKLPGDSAATSANGSSLGNTGGPVELDKITLDAPAGWNRREPSSGFVLAEFYLPKAEEADRDGRLTVSTAGGDIEANIERWRGQFGDKPEKESRRMTQAGGLEITLVDFSGEFNDQRGPFAPATKQPGSRMLAAIIPVEGELFFVKAVGPEKTMAAHADEFMAFVESVKKR
jgi:hypothetical protein